MSYPDPVCFTSNARFSYEGRLSDEEMNAFYLRHDNDLVDE